ncbi:HEPN domain-containing protein, partial [Halomonas sp. BC04]|uniref:HEPN domain-containing protein n=1 Tax=Halomonas sp. BC04 TaxID=1403540 RepID=UPI0018CC337B
MPSASFRKFENNLLIDVDRIIDSHYHLNHDGGGKRGLGHITRSGVLMLCAAWELYIEEVLLEGVDYFTHQLDSPKGLPKPVQKEIARSVKEAKHDLKPLELAGEGWKDLY